MKKITLKFKELYTMFAHEHIDDTIVKTNKKIFVKNSDGKLTQIKGLIRKSDQNMYHVHLKNGIIHNCADKHYLKTDQGLFKYSKDLTKSDSLLIFNSVPSQVISSEFYKTDYAYDISIDAPHEYITPNGLIHHNTTIARILLDSLVKNDMDILAMNGSDTNGIDVVRNTIVGFLKSPAYASKFKYVYIDEFDGTSSAYQGALRNIMETYADTGRFVCTANYQSKIIDPIISRFQVFEMKTLPKEYVIKFAQKILKEEKIEYDDNSVELIVTTMLPDVRKVINTLQKNTIGKKLKKIDMASITSVEKKICGLIVQICDDISTSKKESTLNQNVPQILELLSKESEPDYRQLYQNLFLHPTLPMWAKIKVNQYQNSHMSCAVPSAHFTAMTFDIVQAGMTFISMFCKK
jgi:DNA polymerase III delta prime subunit